MIEVLIQLTSVGASAGPFQIYALPNITTPIANIDKATLLLGVKVSVPDDTTVIRVVSIGECTNYQDVLIDTPAPTTSTTTTALITPATVTIDNNSINLSIVNVLVSSVGITGATFAVDPAEETSGTTPNLGTVTIGVITLGTSTSQSITIIDSAGNVKCEPFIGTGTYSFAGQVVNNVTPVQVIANGTTCSTTSTSSTTTTTTTVLETGSCYNISIPTAALSNGGSDLYVTRQLPGGVMADYLATSLPDTGEWVEGVIVNLCCEFPPIFKYGVGGAYFDPTTQSIVVVTGGVCTLDNTCASPTTTTTTTPAPTTTTTSTPAPTTTTTTTGGA